MRMSESEDIHYHVLCGNKSCGTFTKCVILAVCLCKLVYILPHDFLLEIKMFEL